MNRRIGRYSYSKYCRNCNKWINKRLNICPYCGSVSLKTRPKNQRCKNKYINTKHWKYDDAEKMFQKFIEKDYSVDEAVEFVEAITGIRINFPINVLVKES